MLMGSYQNQIDAKNRFSVPAKFRDDLGHKCVLAKGLDNCLVIYPMGTWEEQQKILAKLPRSDAKARAYLRYTYAGALECEIDKQGRLVIPEQWRAYAHIEKELVTIGMLDRIEIWAKDVYGNDRNGGQLSAEDLAEIGTVYQV